MEAHMNARIFYAAAPLALLLATGANAQITYQSPWDLPYQSPWGLTQDEQTTVYRTIIRENTIPETRPVTRKTTRQVIRTPSGKVVRTTTTERLVPRNAPIMAADERVTTRPRVVERRVVARQPVTTFVTADALDLSQDQRTVVYRTLAQHAPVVTAPVTRPWVTTDQRIINAYDPVFGQRVITTAPVTTGVGTVVTTPAGYPEIVIGARIPETIPVYGMSPAAAAAAPAIAGYNYALVGNRVFLIDPRDGIVVAMLYQ
jgi:hypothetical protein